MSTDSKSEAQDKAVDPDVVLIRSHRPISDGISGEVLAEAGTLGTRLPEVAEHLGNQLVSASYWPSDLTPQEVSGHVHAILGLVTQLGPRNELEAMLAVQAISIHNSAMECLRRAMRYDAACEGTDIYLKHAAKLCQIFAVQIELISRNKRNS